MKTKYAMGFLFTPSLEEVVLIRKNRPAHLAGLLTGAGGHQEDGEAPLQCLVREIMEETGVRTVESDWTHFATVDNERMLMPCYYLIGPQAYEAVTCEDEAVQRYPLKDLSPDEMAPLAGDLIRAVFVFTGEVLNF